MYFVQLSPAHCSTVLNLHCLDLPISKTRELQKHSQTHLLDQTCAFPCTHILMAQIALFPCPLQAFVSVNFDCTQYIAIQTMTKMLSKYCLHFLSCKHIKAFSQYWEQSEPSRATASLFHKRMASSSSISVSSTAESLCCITAGVPPASFGAQEWEDLT